MIHYSYVTVLYPYSPYAPLCPLRPMHKAAQQHTVCSAYSVQLYSTTLTVPGTVLVYSTRYTTSTFQYCTHWYQCTVYMPHTWVHPLYPLCPHATILTHSTHVHGVWWVDLAYDHQWHGGCGGSCTPPVQPIGHQRTHTGHGHPICTSHCSHRHTHAGCGGSGCVVGVTGEW